MGNSGTLSTCGKITKLLFLALNVLYLLIGLAVIAVGSYLVHTGQSYSVFTGNHFFSGAAILIICGIVIFFITAAGIIAGFLEKKWLLYIYIVIVVLIVILEVVAAILGFAFRNKITDRTTSNAREAMQEYYPEGNANHSSSINSQIDSIQENLECCGWGDNGTEYWEETNYFRLVGRYPKSCNCNNNDTDSNCLEIELDMDFQYVYDETCDQGLMDALQNSVVGIGIAGVVFAVVQIVPVLLAIVLAYTIHKARDSYVTV